MRREFNSVLLLLSLLRATESFDYGLVEASGLILTDVKTGITDVLTFFLNEPLTVTVTELVWGEALNGTDPNITLMSYTTYVDGAPQAEGSIDLDTFGRQLPSSIEVGQVSVSSAGSHAVEVVLSLDETVISVSDNYQAYKAGVAIFPLLVIFILALSTGSVELSLGTGIFVGACMVTGTIKDGFKTTLDTYLLNAIANTDHGFVFLFTFFLSGLVSMMEKSGGAFGFTKYISKYASTPRKGQFICYMCGLLIFFDDYANTLLVGETMRPLMDMLSVSRQQLAYVVDATSAPVASITPVSSWVGFELGLIQDQIDKIVLYEGTAEGLSISTSALSVFLISVKYRFYPLFMLLLIPIQIVAQRHYGPMLIAERKTQVYKRTDGGDMHGAGKSIADSSNQPSPDTPQHSWNFFLPVVFLIFFIFYLLFKTGEDGTDQSPIDKLQNSDSYSALLWGTMAAALVTMIMYYVQIKQNGKLVFPTPQVLKELFLGYFQKEQEPLLSHLPREEKEKDEGNEGSSDEDDSNDRTNPSTLSGPPKHLMTIREALDSFLYGMSRIFPALIVLTLAWAAGSVMNTVGADRLFSRWIVDSGLNYQSLPTLSFLISLFMAVATGTSWGTMSIMFPLIVVPSYQASNGDANIFYGVVAGILSGSVAGDHVSPISDTTVLSALASDCTLLGHVGTQAPYVAWTVVFCVLVGTLPSGYDAYPLVVCYLFGFILLVAFVYIICVPVFDKTGRFDIITEFMLRFNKTRKAEYDQLRADTAAAYAQLHAGDADKEAEGEVSNMLVDSGDGSEKDNTENGMPYLETAEQASIEEG